MRKNALVFVGLLAAPPVAAQSRVDRVPETTPQPGLPVAPAPSDEISDAPEQPRPAPELSTPVPEPTPRLVPGAPDSDSLTGHFLPHAGLGYLIGFGQIDNATDRSNTLAPGMSLGFGLGYGVSRSVELGIDGAFASLSGGDACPSCTGKLIEGRLYVGYHLVQGTRFDPWVRFGAGLSSLRLENASQTTDYTGLSIANVTFGGDWFASKYVGFGPFLSFGLNTYFEKPPGRTATLSESLTIGARILFDIAGH